MSGEPTTPATEAGRALLVVEELPAWRLFGPNGQDVVSLLDRVASLDEVRRLAAAVDAAWAAAWAAARADAWAAAGADARAAAAAIVVRDRISLEHYRTLTDPWRSVIGPVPGDPA